jgi:hypothetical protein
LFLVVFGGCVAVNPVIWGFEVVGRFSVLARGLAGVAELVLEGLYVKGEEF